MDMHSGGGLKHRYAYIYIEANEAEAKVIFYNRFGTNPDRVSCTCCGNDYSITSSKSLAQATAYNRGCKYITNKGYNLQTGKSLKEWLVAERKSVLVIPKAAIKASERSGELPEQGYIWR